ncbi:MAG: MFS transporter [Burkholderiales bacterium]|nr:MFS transporter [Burkholderiales bacterium]
MEQNTNFTQRNKKEILLFLVVLSSLIVMSSTDMFLPSIPQIALFFKATDEQARFMIPVYLFGELAAALLWGLISDYFERRKVLLSGILVFILGSLICYFSSNIALFLSGRFIQGMGAIVVPVVGWALIQDIYPADKSAKIMSWVGGIISVGPMFVPALGGYIEVHFGWKYGLLLIILMSSGILWLLYILKHSGEMAKINRRTSLVNSLSAYYQIITNLKFLAYVMIFGVLGTSEWCYLTVAPYFLGVHLGLAPDIVGLYIAYGAMWFVIGAIIATRMLRHDSVDESIKKGIVITICSSIVLLIMQLIKIDTAMVVVTVIGFYFMGTSFVWGNTLSRALQCFPEHKGSASAIRSLFLIASFAIGASLGSIFNHESLFETALFMLLMSIIAYAIWRKTFSL